MRVRFLAIGLIAGILAACSSGGADPKPTPSRSVSAHTSSVTSSPASPSRTGPPTTGPNVRPGEKPPVYPDLARQHNADGALAFAIYFMRSFDWGYATNDPSILQPLSLSSCTGCRTFRNSLEGLKAKRQVLLGGRLSPDSASVLHKKFEFRADFVLDMVYDEQPVVIKTTGKASTTAAPALRQHHTLVFVRWLADGWRVADVTAK